jgi:hypothetical protein
MMTKYGVVTEKSKSDFSSEKKAEYYDALGYSLADEENKHFLKLPKPIKELESSSFQERA